MLAQYEERVAMSQIKVTLIVDRSYEPFVAKLQKAKTRKNKEYFVLRASVPKDAAEKMKVGPGDYVFFRAKKAQWFHMLDWRQMKSTWNLLPEDVRQEVYLAGLVQPQIPTLSTTSAAGSLLTTQPETASPTLAMPLVSLDAPTHGGA
jgi:hypothetical protein